MAGPYEENCFLFTKAALFIVVYMNVDPLKDSEACVHACVCVVPAAYYLLFIFI